MAPDFSNGILGNLLEEGRRGPRIAGEQGLGHSETDATIGVVVLPGVAPVGEVAGDGLALRLGGGGGVSSFCLDFGEDAPSLPRLRGMAVVSAGEMRASWGNVFQLREQARLLLEPRRRVRLSVTNFISSGRAMKLLGRDARAWSLVLFARR